MADDKKFSNTVLDFIDKVAESSKKGFMAAGEAISDFGDKSVVRIEIGQLKSKLSKAYADLGKNVYEKFEMQKLTQISTSDDLDVASLVDSIRKIEAEIKKREDNLENIKKEKKEKKSAGPDSEKTADDSTSDQSSGQ